MAAWLRVLSNPKVLNRFFKTKAGRRAAFKYGNMLLRSKIVRDMVSKFMNTNGSTLKSNRNYAAQQRELAELDARIVVLEQQFAQNKNDADKLETLAFTMGRQVAQMRYLLERMQLDLYKIQQDQMIANKKLNTR